MSALGKVFNVVINALPELNHATLSGAIDIIAVRQPDGSLRCTPWHVRFGKMHTLRPRDRLVNVKVNGSDTGLQMKLGPAGEAFFVEETEEVPSSEWATSPLSSPRLENAASPQQLSQGFNLDDPEQISSQGNQSAAFHEISGAGPVASAKKDISSESVKVGWFGKKQKKIDHSLQPEEEGMALSDFAAQLDDEEFLDCQEEFDDDQGDLGSSEYRDHDDSGSISGTENKSSMQSNESVAIAIPSKGSNDSFAGSPNSSDSASLVGSVGSMLRRFVPGGAGDGSLADDIASPPQSPPDSPRRSNSCDAGETVHSPNHDRVSDDATLAVALDSLQLAAIPSSQLIGGAISDETFGKYRLSFNDAQTYLQEDIGSLYVLMGSSVVPLAEALPVILSQICFGKVSLDLLSALPGLDPRQARMQDQDHPDSNLAIPPIQNAKGLYTKKSLTPPKEALDQLNLKYGKNIIEFSLAHRSNRTVSAFIYMWDNNDKLVVSDIDGTITKSDVLGQFLPMIGKDWSQAGVTGLLNKVQKNDYKVLYVTARPIGQISMTKNYLSTIVQNGETMPEGPVLTSPDRMITSFTREVIRRKPEEFKIECFKSIQSLFPNGTGSPFFAGFGNRGSDAISYRAVDIPNYRIFIVNPHGQISNGDSKVFETSYSLMHEIVDCVFPPVSKREDTSSSGIDGKKPSQYSNHNYWSQRPSSYLSPEQLAAISSMT